MKKWIAVLFLLPILTWTSFANAKALKLEGYGVYIKDANGYSRLKSFDGWDIFYRHLKNIPFVKHETRKPELIVYYPNIKVNSIEAMVHPYIVLARNTRIHPIVKPMDADKDMYQVTFAEEVDSASLLDVSVAGTNFRGLVGLSDPVAKLIGIYSHGTHTASSAVYDLEELMKLYPNVSEFKSLHADWKKKAMIDEDHKDYADVIDLYGKYKRSTTIKGKTNWLNQTLKQIQSYKARHPKGEHIKEANNLETEIKKKLAL